jgi:uncharacterized OsmC-like protein
MSATTTSHAQDRTVRVHLRPAGGYKFEASFPDLPDAAPILLDEPPPLGESAGPNPAGVLAGAIGGCLAASLTFCLRRAHLDGTVEADVEADVVRNERGRFRIGGVRVSLSLDSAADAAKLERCKTLFEDFCIVTESVRHGIPVELSLLQKAAA